MTARCNDCHIFLIVDSDEGLVSNTVDVIAVMMESCYLCYLLLESAPVVMIDAMVWVLMVRRNTHRDSSVRVSMNACLLLLSQANQ